MKSFQKTSYSYATKCERDGNHAASKALNSKLRIQRVILQCLLRGMKDHKQQQILYNEFYFLTLKSSLSYHLNNS